VASSPQGLEEPNSLKRNRFATMQKYTFQLMVTQLKKDIRKILVTAQHSTAQHSNINTLEEIGGGTGSGLIRHSRLPSIKSRNINNKVY